MDLTTHLRAAFVLGLVALAAGFMSVLALADIYHGEPDLALEWRILQGSAVVIVLFVVASMSALVRMLRRERDARAR